MCRPLSLGSCILVQGCRCVKSWYDLFVTFDLGFAKYFPLPHLRHILISQTTWIVSTIDSYISSNK